MKKILNILAIPLIATFLILAFFIHYTFIYFVFGISCLYLVINLIFAYKAGGGIYCKIAIVLSLLFIIPSSLFIFKIDYKNINFVIHGGGSLDSKGYLNSIESVEYYINNNCNLIELDFVFTKDDEIICSHYLEYYENYSIENRPTLEEAKNAKIDNLYSTLDFGLLIEILKQNPSVKIVFDTKESDCKKLISKMLEISYNENFNLKERMIIQVYSYDNYLEMNEFDFEEYWFTNYKVNYNSNKIKKYFSKCENVTTIVLFKNEWKYFKFLNFKTNKKIAVHTVNEKNFIKFLQNHGVDYIYCDYL